MGLPPPPPPPPGTPPPPPPPHSDGGSALDNSHGRIRGKEVAAPIVTQVAQDSVDGYTTYRLSLVLDGDAAGGNIYTIFGEQGSPLSVPAAYQVASPFGVDIGGTFPAFWAAQAESQYDSWLTIGMTEGNANNALANIGIPFDDWSATQAIETEDGAVFYMNPDSGPSGTVVVAQLTVPDGSDFTVTMGAQGRGSTRAHDWQDIDNVFATAGAGQPGGGH